LLLAILIIIASAAVLLPGLTAHNPGQTTTTPAAKATHKPVATTTTNPVVSPTPTATPGTTTTPGSGYPTLANQYKGNIYDTLSKDNTSMALNSIQQNGGTITGNFQVGPPLAGNGPFTGTINTSGALQFTVHSSQVSEPLLFTGNLHSDGSLSGTYCSLNTTTGKCDYTNGYGNWTVFPSTSYPLDGQRFFMLEC